LFPKNIAFVGLSVFDLQATAFLRLFRSHAAAGHNIVPLVEQYRL
jgi:hypothetical protein